MRSIELQSRTAREMGKATKWVAAALLALSALPVAPADPAPSWPPCLPASDTYADDIREAVQQTWIHATFSRTVHGRPARVPFSLYAALVDTPEITTAAAPSAPPALAAPAGTCWVLSSLHPLKEWSLQETRGGSVMAGTGVTQATRLKE